MHNCKSIKKYQHQSYKQKSINSNDKKKCDNSPQLTLKTNAPFNLAHFNTVLKQQYNNCKHENAI